MPGFDVFSQQQLELSGGSIWEQLKDWPRYAETLAVLSVAVLLAAVLAYHPSSQRKASTRVAVEQSKTTVLYGLVGALVGHLVAAQPSMALVIFGIGGLLRFRTLVGEAKDTGRVILAAIVGICVGLQSYLVAVLTTGFAWVIIWYLELQVIGSVAVLGVEQSNFKAAVLAYRRLLEAEKCRVVGEGLNLKTGYVELVFKAPPEVSIESLQSAADRLEAALRGQPRWELS